MWARSFLFPAIFYTLTALWATLLMTTLPFRSRKPLLRGIVFWCDVVFWLSRHVAHIRVDIRGRDKLPTKGPFIVACKHQSTLDAFAVFKCFPNLVTLGKIELFRVPILGSILRKIDLVAIDRESGTAHKEIPGADRLFVERRRVLVLFPEGTRVPAGEEKPLKTGVYHFHRRTGLPVYTMATNSGWFWPARKLWLRPGVAVFEFHDAMPSGLDRDQFMTLLRERVIVRSTELLRQGQE